MGNRIICKRCVINSDVPGVSFDSNGICIYCHLHDKLEKEWPQGQEGEKVLQKYVSEMKEKGKGKRGQKIEENGEVKQKKGKGNRNRNARKTFPNQTTND